MFRERILKILLVLVGLALIAGIYPLATSLSHTMNSQVSLGDQMILGIYFPIGIFLLLAARNPLENRSLILCFAWSTLAHMGVMLVQAVQAHSLREDLPALLVISVICVALLLLTPARRPPPRALEAPA
jgi:hypothetical protein